MGTLLAVLGFLVGALVTGVALLLVVLVGYLLFLTVAAVLVWIRRPAERLGADGAPQMATAEAGRLPAAGRWATPQTRFAVLVPAHNEELLIRRVVGSLLAVDYPPDLYHLHVIADNCTDRTAELAQAAGVTVHERTDPDQHGKGYALRWLFGQLLADPAAGDAFVIVDADSLVNRGFLRALDRRLRRGAVAIQAYDTVLNTAASWGTALRYIAFCLLHYLRPLGRKLFTGSAGLKGNGMAFRRSVLEGMHWDAFSVTEDLQFHLDLLLGGQVVEFAPDAIVWSEMPGSLQAAHAQNVRWESGQLELLSNYVPHLWEYVDMGDLGALIAPRPLLIETGRWDPLNGTRGVDNVNEQVAIARQAYTLLGADDQLDTDVFDGPHKWHGAKVLGWLDKHLRR